MWYYAHCEFGVYLRYNPASFGHSVAQAKLALGIKTLEDRGERCCGLYAEHTLPLRSEMLNYALRAHFLTNILNSSELDSKYL